MLFFQIDTETKDARKSADQTAGAVETLQEKLNKLQRKFLKNDRDAKEIKIQADAVKDSASNTHEKAKKVKLFSSFFISFFKCFFDFSLRINISKRTTH